MKVKVDSEKLAELLSQIRYTVSVRAETIDPSHSCYRADAHELKIFARGETPDEAVINLDKRKREHMNEIVKSGTLPPMPGPDAVWGVQWGNWETSKQYERNYRDRQEEAK